ncbi:hypothetical protein KCP76_14380 [Salmonella enterica subsp. enterica serovar Weltevreden]|nr:hypothetical protein KCP76_14380 [Salmonella enterica subsp. enterica serovar Weltevreden]
MGGHGVAFQSSATSMMSVSTISSVRATNRMAATRGLTSGAHLSGHLRSRVLEGRLTGTDG